MHVTCRKRPVIRVLNKLLLYWSDLQYYKQCHNQTEMKEFYCQKVMALVLGSNYGKRICNIKILTYLHSSPSSFGPVVHTTAWPHYISGQILSSHSIVSSTRTVRPCSPWGGRWIGHWRTTWSTVCSSAPHSQATEEAIPYLYKQERKRPTPVQRRLSRTQALLGRVIPGVWLTVVGDENAEPCGVVRPLCIPLVIRPLCRTYVVVRWTDEMLCGGYKLVSRFEAPCVCTRWTDESWVEQMPRLHDTAC